jgi:gliding motility-associated-like protein
MRIEATGYSSYLWSNGSTAGFIDVSTSGQYFVTVKDFNNCTGTDSITIQPSNCIPVNIPNSFTPNGDGRNDIFKPGFFLQLSSYSFVVFNRYGQKVFETREKEKGWDGTLKGKAQPSDSYVYTIRYTNIFGVENIETGSVLLIR